MSPISQFRRLLNEIQREAISSLFEIADSMVDTGASMVEARNGVVRCELVSPGERACPMTFAFVENIQPGLGFVFILGRGVEIYDNEKCDSYETAVEISKEIRIYLGSNITVEHKCVRGVIKSSCYTIEDIYMHGRPMQLTHTSAIRWPFARVKKMRHIYESWI